MIVQRIAPIARRLFSATARYAAPVLRIYTRTFVSQRHRYTEGYIQMVKEDVALSTPIAFRYIKGSELVQQLTSVAFDLISEHLTLQQWYAYQWESLCSAIVEVIEEEILQESDEDEDDTVCDINIDSYMVEEMIGDESCCATVYKAQRGAKPVALKAMYNFLEPHLDMLSLDNLGAELVSLSIPPHPNIININNHFVAKNTPLCPSVGEEYPAVFEFGGHDTLYIEMPLFNCSLRQYLLNKPLTEEEVVWVLYQVVSGVHHLHHHRLVHRDLKADNILLHTTPQGVLEAVITDFGMAYDQLTTPCHPPSGKKWGNPCTMPPEIAESRDRREPLDYTAADMWSVGLLVYEMYGSPNPTTQIKDYHLSYNPMFLPALPTDNHVICSMVRELLSRDPTSRPTPEQCLMSCGVLLWLPELYDTKPSLETIAEQLTMLSWSVFRDLSREGHVISCLERSLIYFLKHASASRILQIL